MLGLSASALGSVQVALSGTSDSGTEQPAGEPSSMLHIVLHSPIPIPKSYPFRCIEGGCMGNREGRVLQV